MHAGSREQVTGGAIVSSHSGSDNFPRDGRYGRSRSIHVHACHADSLTRLRFGVGSN